MNGNFYFEKVFIFLYIQQQEPPLETESDNPIELKITDFYDSGSSTWVKEELTNVSDQALKYIEIRVIFKDDDGNIIDSSDTYADADVLLPNASTKFSTYVSFDSRITKSSAAIIDYSVEE